MRFTILAAPGSDPGDARSRASAVVTVDGPEETVAAARAAADRHVLLLAPGARPLPGAFGGLSASLGDEVGILGGAAHADGLRAFGWMLDAAPLAPVPFELVALAAPRAQQGVDAQVRGAVDVVAPGMVLVARTLLEAPLPADPAAAMVELCARARDAGLSVVCRPSFACEVHSPSADDRGRAAALRALAERRAMRGGHRLPAGMRNAVVDRDVRLGGGSRVRMRIAIPPLTVLVHGAGAELAARRARTLAPTVTARAVDDAAAALRAEMRVRGDRYVLVAAADRVPDAGGFATLVEAIESNAFVALAAPDAAALDGACVLLALARFPQHVEPVGASIADALSSLIDAAVTVRRAVRAPGFVPPDVPARRAGSATIVFLAQSAPEIVRLTLGAVVESSRAGDEIVAICAANAETARRLVAVYPQVRIELDDVDPLLAGAANRAIAAAATDLVVLVADDVLLPAGALDRMRAAFARIPALGAAFPAVPGGVGGEGIGDVGYADVAELRTLAERRAVTFARQSEPIEIGAAPALVVARVAFEAVGGIDPNFGPTRRGIADLTQRLRAAGYALARCDDALAHRFGIDVTRSPLAAADAQQPVPVADPAAVTRGFDPVRRVPFTRPASAVAASAPAASHAIVVAVAGAAELERAAVFVAAAARAFDASAPVRVHLVLDGTVGSAEAAARLRPVLAGTARAIEETVAVRIERVSDLAAWRAALEAEARIVVAAGHEREPLAGLAVVTADGLRGVLIAGGR